MELFRGDKIHNDKTKPGLYRGNGLRSKAFGGESSPRNIEIIGLLETIRKHIKPQNSDSSYYDVTDYLSFSEKRDRALYWCSDMNTLNLKPCNEYDETRYLFKMNIEDTLIKKLDSGIYQYSYICNPKLKSSDSKPSIYSPIPQIFRNQICPICSNVHRNHSIILINSYEYLKHNAKHEKYKGALSFALQDNEWLVLPADNLDGNNKRSTRIPRANFWNTEHFKVTGEKRPRVQ